jgi:urea-proton symporter
LIEDVYRKLIRPQASEAHLRRAGALIIVGLGVVTWILCAPRLGDLIEVLFLSGPLVASAIWPVLAGLYWKRANPTGALVAMLAGSLCGLVAYYTIGWYTASLLSALVSMVAVVAARFLAPRPFDWNQLNEHAHDA